MAKQNPKLDEGEKRAKRDQEARSRGENFFLLLLHDDNALLERLQAKTAARADRRKREVPGEEPLSHHFLGWSHPLAILLRSVIKLCKLGKLGSKVSHQVAPLA